MVDHADCIFCWPKIPVSTACLDVLATICNGNCLQNLGPIFGDRSGRALHRNAIIKGYSLP